MSSVKIQFAPDETGWAESLGDSKYRINNIPLAEDLNIDDVVYAEQGESNCLEVIDILERKFHFKTLVRYPTVDHYKAMRERLNEKNCKMEGMVGPHEGRPGMCFIAHDKDVDLESVFAEVGVDNFETYEVE